MKVKNIDFKNELDLITINVDLETNEGKLEHTQLIIDNRDIRHLYRRGKEESLAYTLVRPLMDSIKAIVESNESDWSTFIHDNGSFTSTLIDKMIENIKML